MIEVGARSGSLYKTLVAHARNQGAPGDRAPVRQQPCNEKEINTRNAASEDHGDNICNDKTSDKDEVM